MDVVLSRPKIIEVEKLVMIMEGPVEGGKKLDHRDLKGEKKTRQS